MILKFRKQNKQAKVGTKPARISFLFNVSLSTVEKRSHFTDSRFKFRDFHSFVGFIVVVLFFYLYSTLNRQKNLSFSPGYVL